MLQDRRKAGRPSLAELLTVLDEHVRLLHAHLSSRAWLAEYMASRDPRGTGKRR